MHADEELASAGLTARSPIQPADHPVEVTLIAAGHRTLRAKRPIAFRITRDDDLYFAENEELSIYGNGISTQDALNDAFSQVIYFYDYYAALAEEQTVGKAKSLKRRLQDLRPGSDQEDAEDTPP